MVRLLCLDKQSFRQIETSNKWRLAMLKQLRLTVFVKAIFIAHFFVVPAHGMLSSRLASRFIANKFVRSGVEKILYRFLPQSRFTQSVTPSIPRTLLPKNQRLIHTQRKSTQPKLRQRKPTQRKLTTKSIVKPPQDRVLQKSRVPHQPVNRFELSHSPWSKNRFMSKMFYGGIGPAVGLGIVAGSKIVAIGEEFLSIVESIIYEKELFKKIEQNDDSIIPMLEKIFVTKEKSKLAEKVFKKLIETNWGTTQLDHLLKRNSEVAKLFISVLAADTNNIAELFKNPSGIFFLEYLIEKDSNVAKLLISVLAADTNNIVQLCKDLDGSKYLDGIYLLRDLMEEDPRLVKQVTSVLAADTNNIVQLLKNSSGIYLLRYLIEKDSNAAKLLISVLAADTNNIVQLCKDLDGSKYLADSKKLDGICLLRDLMEEDSSVAKQVIFETLMTDASFDLCKEPRGRKFLKFLIDKNPSMFSQLPDTIVRKMAPYLFYLFTKKGSCGDIKDLVEKIDGDNLGSLFKQLIYCYKCKNNQVVGTQTSIDMKQNLKRIIKSRIVHVLQKPLVKKMLDDVFKKEQALQSDYYTFLHGQRWAVALPERWFTWLWSLKNNQSCKDKDFIFCHVEKPEDNENQLIQEEELRRKILDKGGESGYSPHQSSLEFSRLQFLTWSLFSNSTNLASNPVNYFFGNDNCNSHRIKKISIKSAFEDLGFAHIYEKYKNQLDNLEQEHKNLSEHGQMLLFAIPKAQIEDCVFPVTDDGRKDRVFIDGLGNTNDISIIMETLRNNPEKINYNNLQFALVKTWDFALNPEKSGIKVFPFNAADADSEKVKKFRAKEEELFRQIKQDIMNAR